MEEGKPLLGIVAGTAMLHTGRGASLTSPSGPQDSAVVFEAVKQASIGVTDMNAVACWGQGRLLEDAVEAQALSSSLRGDTENFEVPLVIASGMTQFGNAQDTVGMASLIRMLIGQRYGVMSPGLHLGTLSPHIDTWSGGQPLLINSEVIAYPGNTTYHGLTGKSLSGVLVHVVMFADLLPQLVPQPAAEEEVDLQIAFWPGGGGSLPDDAEPITGRPYSVMGSWSEWSVTEPMTSEGKGVYKLLVTLGPNRFEQFQVVLDSRKDSVLHPAWPEAGSGSAVHGPSPVEDVQHLRWTIDGRSPADALTDGGASGQDCALPGASFRVTLRVSGKWRSVEWEKVADPDPSSARQVDEGRYYVVGDFNDWTFQDELRLMDDGIYTAEVGPFPIGSGDFQIVRNQDWHQTFCPADQEDWEGPSQVMGPAEGPEQCWQLWPLPGDRFAIEFCRATDASGLDQRSISWQRARRRPLLGGE